MALPSMPAFSPLTNVRLTGLARDLADRADAGRPIRVGVIGSGEMGTDLVTQGSLMRGIEVCAIATRRPHTAREAMVIAFGDAGRAVEADSPAKATAAIETGRIAVTSAETLVTTPSSTSSSMRPASPASPPTTTCSPWSTASTSS